MRSYSLICSPWIAVVAGLGEIVAQDALCHNGVAVECESGGVDDLWSTGGLREDHCCLTRTHVASDELLCVALYPTPLGAHVSVTETVVSGIELI